MYFYYYTCIMGATTSLGIYFVLVICNTVFDEFIDTNVCLFYFFQPKFLDLAFGAALAIFLMLEIIRVSNVIYTQLRTRSGKFIF